MATPESLYKYATTDQAETILATNKLRWSSPELFDEPWAIKLDPKLGFDHLAINKAMLKTAVSMIFTRDMPSGNLEHPLYKAIRRWRSEDRFHDELEAFGALSELLAPTPDTLQQRLHDIVAAWKNLVANSRILCLSETNRDIHSWACYAENHRGLALKFGTDDSVCITDPKPVSYVNQRCHLTTVKEQVDDLVGIKRAAGINGLEQKILTKNKYSASEKEWRCIRHYAEEELDCGEDVEDWYLDEKFDPAELQAIYFGFLMPMVSRKKIIQLVKSKYPHVVLYAAYPLEHQYDLDFEKISC